MKSIKTIAAIIYLTASSFLTAQTKGFFIGAEGGAGITALTGDFYQNSKARIGYSSGIVVGYDFGKILSLRSGLYFDVKGTSYERYAYGGFGPSKYYTGEASFNYLTCPLLLRAAFGENLKFFVNAGPYAAYLLSEFERETAGTIDHTQYYKSMNFGFIAGPGVAYAFRQFTFSLEARNSMGVTTLGTKYSFIMGNRSRVFASNLLLGVTYKIRKNSSVESDEGYQGWLVGMEGGVGIAGLRGNFMGRNLRYFDRRSYNSGLFIQYDFKTVFSLRTGIYYDLKGAAYDRTTLDIVRQEVTYHKGTADFNYLTIPLLLRLSTPGKAKVFINAGPYASVLLSVIDQDQANRSSQVNKLDRSADYAKVDAGLIVGLGISYPVKKLVFSLEGRDCLGLTAISANSMATGVNVRNNAFNVLLGVAYRLGKNKEAPEPSK